MDTVQNIANVVVGAGTSSGVGHSSDEDVKSGINAANHEDQGVNVGGQVGGRVGGRMGGRVGGQVGGQIRRQIGCPLDQDEASSASDQLANVPPSRTAATVISSPDLGTDSRRAFRTEFLSRPNWLFTHNENVLFCTALNSLRFPDQNNVPRKFIEEWLSDRMVTMETRWPAGSKFLSDLINELRRDKAKYEERKAHEIRQRQREFHKNRKQALHLAEKAFKAARTPEATEQARQAYEEAKAAANEPVDSISVQAPSPQEIALLELQTKIVRRLQGQTDRLSMAEQLAHKPYAPGASEYFKELQDDVLTAIAEKHQEIAEEREKVEAKSKQSRKRRRNQVSNGITMSGSATRVRFTNREIAMLIHWIYSYPKSEWSSRIFEFYTQPGTARSAEHVRDKMRDLITRSRDTERGGLTSMRTRSASSYFGKSSETVEMMQLAQHDLQDFKYPVGVLGQLNNHRYFDEERAAWVDGPLPDEYIRRYHEEVGRIHRVVRAKVMRTRDHSVDTGVLHPESSHLFDDRLVNSQNPLLGNNAFGSDPDFDIASTHLEAYPKDDVNVADQSTEFMTAIATAALKSENNDQYLRLVQEENARTDKESEDSKEHIDKKPRH